MIVVVFTAVALFAVSRSICLTFGTSFLTRSLVAATCSDDIKNQNETDVDCGGACLQCSDGAACKINADCTSLHCSQSVCGKLLAIV
jgi:hypothetical protein